MSTRIDKLRVVNLGAGCEVKALVKFTWHGDMPYSGVEWGLAFPVRAICPHRERGYAPQIPVEGLPVPGEFHGRWYLREYAYWHRSWNIRTPVATSTAAGNSPKGLSSQWPLRCKRLGMKGKAGHAFPPRKGLTTITSGIERLSVGTAQPTFDKTIYHQVRQLGNPIP